LKEKGILYRETERYMSHHKTNKHQCTRFGSQTKQSSKQPFLRGLKASISIGPYQMVGAGMSSNSIRIHFCWHIPRLI